MGKWKKTMAAAAAALVLTAAFAGCGDEKSSGQAQSKPAAGQTIRINFPTAGASGALYAVGAAITNMWSQNIPGMQAASQASAGGIANLNMVSDGEAQVSIAISSNVYQCLNGTDSFEGHAYKDLKAIGGLYLNPNQVVAAANTNINSLEGFKGKKFAVASAGSSVYNECDVHFTAAGMKFPEDIQAEYITFTDAADMLQNGSIDGAWIMSGAPASAVTQALTSGAHLVPIPNELIEKLKAKYPWYTSYTIKAGTYPNQNEDVNTSAIKMVMFCRGDLPDDVVYQMTKTLWEHMDELGQSQKNLKGLTAENAVRADALGQKLLHHADAVLQRLAGFENMPVCVQTGSGHPGEEALRLGSGAVGGLILDIVEVPAAGFHQMLHGHLDAPAVIDHDRIGVRQSQRAVGKDDGHFAQKVLHLCPLTDGVENRADQDETIHLLLRHGL